MKFKKIIYAASMASLMTGCATSEFQSQLQTILNGNEAVQKEQSGQEGQTTKESTGSVANQRKTQEPVRPVAPPPVPQNTDPKSVSIRGMEGAYDFSQFENIFNLVSDLRARNGRYNPRINISDQLTGYLYADKQRDPKVQNDPILKKEIQENVAAGRQKLKESLIDQLAKNTINKPDSWIIPFNSGQQDLTSWYENNTLKIRVNATPATKLNPLFAEKWAEQISTKIKEKVESRDVAPVDFNISPDSGTVVLPVTIDQAKSIRDAVQSRQASKINVTTYNWAFNGYNGMHISIQPVAGTILNQEGTVLASFGDVKNRMNRTEKALVGACRKTENEYVSSFCPMTTSAFECIFAKKKEYQNKCGS